MPEQPRHLANKYEDIVNLQGAEAYCFAMRTACLGHSAPAQTGRPTLITQQWQMLDSYVSHSLAMFN